MHPNNIHTERLLLVPFTIEVARSLMPGGKSLLSEIGLQPTKYWPDQEAMNSLPRTIQKLEKAMTPTGFEAWMIVLKSNNTVIGDAGFKGPPNKEGEVDIGYSIIEQEQQKGYGLEMAQALVEWALAQPNVRAVTAKCLLENGASAQILRRLGMKEIIRDDEVIYWKLER